MSDPAYLQGLTTTLLKLSRDPVAALPVALELASLLPTPRSYLTVSTICRELCAIEEATEWLRHAIALAPEDGALRLRHALLLPPMMGNDASGERARVEAEMEALAGGRFAISDPVQQLPVLDFFSAYYGENERKLRQNLAAFL